MGRKEEVGAEAHGRSAAAGVTAGWGIYIVYIKVPIVAKVVHRRGEVGNGKDSREEAGDRERGPPFNSRGFCVD